MCSLPRHSCHSGRCPALGRLHRGSGAACSGGPAEHHLTASWRSRIRGVWGPCLLSCLAGICCCAPFCMRWAMRRWSHTSGVRRGGSGWCGRSGVACPSGTPTLDWGLGRLHAFVRGSKLTISDQLFGVAAWLKAIETVAAEAVPVTLARNLIPGWRVAGCAALPHSAAEATSRILLCFNEVGTLVDLLPNLFMQQAAGSPTRGGTRITFRPAPRMGIALRRRPASLKAACAAVGSSTPSHA